MNGYSCMYDDPKCQQNDPISLFFERFVNQHWTGDPAGRFWLSVTEKKAKE